EEERIPDRPVLERPRLRRENEARAALIEPLQPEAEALREAPLEARPVLLRGGGREPRISGALVDLLGLRRLVIEPRVGEEVERGRRGEAEPKAGIADQVRTAVPAQHVHPETGGDAQ